MLTPETIQLLGGTKKDVDKDKNDENAPKLESIEVALFSSLQSCQKWLSTQTKLWLLFQINNLQS